MALTSRVLKYVLFSFGAFWLMRLDKLAPPSAHWNRSERTITQNGALYALQHRSAKTGRRNLRKKAGGAALIRVFTNLRRCILAFTKPPIFATKLHSPSLATVGHFADVFPY